MKNATAQGVVILATTTAACSAGAPIPNAQTGRPQSKPAECPTTETSWDDASVVGASATQLSAELGGARSLAIIHGNTAALFGSGSAAANPLQVSLAPRTGNVTTLHCPGTPVLLRFPVRATLTAPAVAPITFDAHLVASSSDSATLSAIATFPAGPTPIGLWLGKGNAELIAGRPAVRWSTLCGEDPNAVAARVLGASLADVLAEAARGPLVCEKAGGTATNAISPATPQLSLGALTGPACRQQANLAAISIPVQLTVNAADGWIAHSLNGHVALDERTKTAKISGTGRLPVTERTREWLGCPSVSGHYTVNVFATLGTQTPNASLELELISSCEDTSIRCTGTVR